MPSAERYWQEVTNRLARETSVRVTDTYGRYATGLLTLDEAIGIQATMIASAQRRATTVNDMILAAELTKRLEAEHLAAGITWMERSEDQVSRLSKAVTSVLAADIDYVKTGKTREQRLQLEAQSIRARLTRLTTGEVVEASQWARQQAMQVWNDQGAIAGWYRRIQPKACEFCRKMAGPGDPAQYIHPVQHRMATHPGCTCSQGWVNEIEPWQRWLGPGRQMDTIQPKPKPDPIRLKHQEMINKWNAEMAKHSDTRSPEYRKAKANRDSWQRKLDRMDGKKPEPTPRPKPTPKPKPEPKPIPDARQKLLDEVATWEGKLAKIVDKSSPAYKKTKAKLDMAQFRLRKFDESGGAKPKPTVKPTPEPESKLLPKINKDGTRDVTPEDLAKIAAREKELKAEIDSLLKQMYAGEISNPWNTLAKLNEELDRLRKSRWEMKYPQEMTLKQLQAAKRRSTKIWKETYYPDIKDKIEADRLYRLEQDHLSTRIADAKTQEIFDSLPRMEPSSILDASKGANPLYDDYTLPKYKTNCQRVCQVVELRVRGYDVRAARETSSMTAPQCYEGWIDPLTGKPPQLHWLKNRQAVEDHIAAEWPEGARGFISCSWKTGSAHIFNIAKIDGRVVLIEGQTGRTAGPLSKDFVDSYFSQMKDNTISVGRIDNCDFVPSTLIKRKVIEVEK